MTAKMTEALAEAEAKVAALRREIAQGPCRQYGHDWQLYGGANAGCSDVCGCSVPVSVCSKCGDCDYGDNEEADEIRATCAGRAALEPPHEH